MLAAADAMVLYWLVVRWCWKESKGATSVVVREGGMQVSGEEGQGLRGGKSFDLDLVGCVWMGG